jgi:hypothetical protein
MTDPTTKQPQLERGVVLGERYRLDDELGRAMANVHFRRGNLGEALRCCEEVLELTEAKDPKVSRLWLGPLLSRRSLQRSSSIKRSKRSEYMKR